MATSYAQQAAAPFRSSQVMQRLGFKSRSAFWQTVRTQGIPHVRVTAKHIVFPAAALERWVASRTMGGAK